MALIYVDQLGNQYTLTVSQSDLSLQINQSGGGVTPSSPVVADQNGNRYFLSVNSADGSLTLTPATTQAAGFNPLSYTAQQIINSAARAAHIIARAESLPIGQMNDALDIANQMLDRWNAERLTIFNITRGLFALTPGKQTYTLGMGGDFQVPRYPRLDRAGIINLANPIQPLELPMDLLTADQWQAIPVKNIQSALPLKLYDDGQYPLRNLNFWCVPNTNVQVALYYWNQLGTLSLGTFYEFPPAYFEAIRYNLAVRMAIEWPGELTPQLQEMAVDSLGVVKHLNAPIVDLRCDPALQSPQIRAYDWRSDTPVSH